MSKAGVSEADQLEALDRAGVTNPEAIYIDRPAKRRRNQNPTDPTPERTWAIKSLRDGTDDELVIASPSALGLDLQDALDALAAICERGAVLYVVSLDKRFVWHPQAAEGLDLARAMETERRVLAARHARRGPGARHLGDRKVLKGKVLDEAKVAWADARLTAKEAALKVGVPVKTLYTRLGARGTPIFGRKPDVGQKPSKMRISP